MPSHPADRPTLAVTCGVPGSGKTTQAVEWQHGDRHVRMRLNRDDYRDMMVGGWTGEPEHERAVTLAQHAGIRALLADGYSVVADDTNLHPERLAELKTLATECEAEFVIFDLTGEDPAECIDRVHERAMRGGRYVPAGVILGMHRRWLATEQASTP